MINRKGQGAAVAGMEELDAAHARRISGGNPVLLAAGVAIAGLMLTAAAAGLKFGYTVLGPWVMDQN
ncbi:MAG TPA: hypothetical protein VFW98_06340 [Gemmatimonadaceae bacterium]|nr:hypothetical protein [Gemmatimonadaceae bacterium]